MGSLKKYSFDGAEVGVVEVNDLFSSSKINGQLIKDYIVALRENKRQWSASTKGRSEVKHTTKKPRPQKGSGNARQGSLVAPQFRGGGIVFGPKPKFNQHVRINKKERQAAIRYLLGKKMLAGDVCVIETTEMEAPKTRVIADFLKKREYGRRVLFLAESNFTEVSFEDYRFKVAIKSTAHENFKLSVRNLQGVEFSFAQNINAYDIMLADKIIVTEAAMQELENWLCAAKRKEDQ